MYKYTDYKFELPVVPLPRHTPLANRDLMTENAEGTQITYLKQNGWQVNVINVCM